MNNLPCIIKTLKSDAREVTILVDCAATNNYIKPSLQIGSRVKLDTPSFAKTLHGVSKLEFKQKIHLLNQDLDFIEMDRLTDFDMMIGERSLRKMKAKINLFEYKLTYSIPTQKQKNELQQIKSVQRINFTNDCPEYASRINELMKKNEQIYPTLPFTTTIEATIKTKNDDPVWVKQYPYPMSDHDFVNKEIERLLKNGIIRKSCSPYNSPIWTVPKKGTDENNKPKRRMVIDYSKLNAQTITDRSRMCSSFQTRKRNILNISPQL